MPIPIVYRKSSEGVTANYNYTDIAEGTGIIVFFGYAENDSTGKTYHLNQQALFSYDIEYTATAIAEGAAAKVIDLDFDLANFNLPKSIKGRAMFTVPLRVTAAVGAGVTTSAYIVARLRKWNGTTETEISDVQSNTISATNNTSTYQIMIFGDTVPLSHFKKGETLRLTIEVYGANTGGGGATNTCQIAFDPMDREGTNFTETNIKSRILQLNCPFVIDL